MSLPSNFKGYAPSIANIKANQYWLVVIDQINYVRGGFNTGAQILNLGICNDVKIEIKDGLVVDNNFGVKCNVSHDVSLECQNVSPFDLTAINGLKRIPVTLAVLKTEDVHALTGFTIASDWTGVKGMVSAIAVFQNVFLETSMVATNADITKLNIKIDAKNISTGYNTVFSDYDPIGTPNSLWDFSINSLTDSVGGIVLTATGQTFTTDHFDISAAANAGFSNSVNEALFDIAPTTKYFFAYADGLNGDMAGTKLVIGKKPGTGVSIGWGIYQQITETQVISLADGTTQVINSVAPQAELSTRFKSSIFLNFEINIARFYITDVNGYTYTNEVSISSLVEASMYNTADFQAFYNLAVASSVYKLAFARS